MSKFSDLFHYYFNLDADREAEADIIKSISANISFRGSNLWTLIFAIIVASVGLNVNSTAVIIGAMLISPLMGPIMGVGLGISISDFDLVRRGIKNLLIAVIISIVTSTIYFYVTPLHNANSELLARTTPTIWDVLIAFGGGLAGAVGVTRKEKSNTIPGVAIATALMPPLCTAGFGLATGHYYYLFGALYLFFINSVFICIATLLVLRFMNFHKRAFPSEARRKRVTRYIWFVVFVTVTPSIWLAYRIVQKAVFENAAQNYVQKEFSFPRTQVVSKNFLYYTKPKAIELLLIGQVLDSATIDTLRQRLALYNLKNTRLVLRQGLDASKEIDFAQIKASILDEVFKDEDSIKIVSAANVTTTGLLDLRSEIKALFPQIVAYSISSAAVIRTDSIGIRDSVIMINASGRRPLGVLDQQKLKRWLATKLATDSVQLVYRQTK